MSILFNVFNSIYKKKKKCICNASKIVVISKIYDFNFENFDENVTTTDTFCNTHNNVTNLLPQGIL